MSDCIAKLEEKAIQTFSYSGRNFDTIGDYKNCLLHQGMQYNYVSFQLLNTNEDSGYFVGVCVPTQCDQSTVTMALNTILQTLKLPLQVFEIDVNLSNYSRPFDWVFFLTFFITIIMSGLVLLSSLLYKIRKHQRTKLVKIFSVQENWKHLQRKHGSNLNVLNGIRSISMCWVVVGHCLSSSIGNATNINTIEKTQLLTPEFLFLDAGLLSVDVFFYIGGLLVAYVLLRNPPKGNLEYLLAIFQRCLRLWPSYLFAIMVFYGIFLHLGEGPQWGRFQPDVQKCKYFWRSLLFIDNLVKNGTQQCLGWGWYLQNDMQLFILSMGIMLVYSKNKLVSKMLIILLIIGSLIFTFSYTMRNKGHVIIHLIDTATGGNFMKDAYIKPWARAPPYIFGLMFGMFYSECIAAQKNKDMQESDKPVLLKFANKIANNKILRIIVELTGLAIMLFVILIPRTLQLDIQWDQGLHSLYLSCARMVFVIGLTILILPSLLGVKHSLVMFTMDTSFFNFIAKISFCTYLVHLIIILTWNSSKKYDYYYTLRDQFVIFLGLLVISLFFGFLVTFIIEFPCANLQKKLINRLKKTINPNHSQLSSFDRDGKAKIASFDSNNENLLNKSLEDNKSTIN